MTEHEDQFPEVAKVLRRGVNDAYRYGLGAAIQVLTEYRTQTTDPTMFDAVIAQLQHLSLQVGSEVSQ